MIFTRSPYLDWFQAAQSGSEEGMKSVGLMAIGLQKAIECLMQYVDVIGDDIYQITVFGLVPSRSERLGRRNEVGWADGDRSPEGDRVPHAVRRRHWG